MRPGLGLVQGEWGRGERFDVLAVAAGQCLGWLRASLRVVRDKPWHA